MGQVAEPVAGAEGNDGAVLDQAVELIDQGADLAGKIAAQGFGFAAPDPGNPDTDGAQGSKRQVSAEK